MYVYSYEYGYTGSTWPRKRKRGREKWKKKKIEPTKAASGICYVYKGTMRNLQDSARPTLERISMTYMYIIHTHICIGERYIGCSTALLACLSVPIGPTTDE